MTKPSLRVVRGLGNDLPPKWDGQPVTWEGWNHHPTTMELHLPDDQRACDQCGAIDSKRTNLGRTFRDNIVDKILLARRCRHCNHDTVYDLHADHLWDLDPSDYSDEGSYELGQGALL